MKKVFGVARWTYNQVVSLWKDDKTMKKKDARLKVTHQESKAMKNNPWLKEVGECIRDGALCDVFNALKAARSNKKNGNIKKFELGFKSKNHMDSDSIYIPHRNIKRVGSHISIQFPNYGKVTIRLHGDTSRVDILHDCRIQRLSTNEFFLCVPITTNIETKNKNHILGERVCVLDPGVRSFQTIFDVNEGRYYNIGSKDVGLLYRLMKHKDTLRSKIDNTTNGKCRRHLKLASDRIQQRMFNLVDDVHKKVVHLLASTYDRILLPSFNVKEMINKKTRNIWKRSVRQLLSWKHYTFKQRMIFKCEQLGCTLDIVKEDWTSKTCSSCGLINHSLGASKIFKCVDPLCGFLGDRDANASKNIFLKNYEALGLFPTPALGPSPFMEETLCCMEVE